jgi:AcrR family transcriptional regulator
MARMLKPTAHAARRDAFVDAAKRLIRSRGYEQMSVQNVLDDLGASRGAFYHYFDSKVALLEAVVERMVDESVAGLQPLLADTNLCAIDKLRGLFAGVARFKAADRELVCGLTRTWLSDDNALARDKLRRLTVERLTPVLAVIVRQGQREGSFVPASPAATARCSSRCGRAAESWRASCLSRVRPIPSPSKRLRTSSAPSTRHTSASWACLAARYRSTA